MKCPKCGGKLYPSYRLLDPPLILDGQVSLRPRQELADLTCDSCQQSWYALAGETAATAYVRICQEEPHP